MTQPGGEHAASFVNRLLRLGDSQAGGREAAHRASLAELRRGLGRTPGEAPGAYREVLALMEGPEANSRFEDACFQVATLYALYPHNEGTPRHSEQLRRRNLGGSLRLLGSKEERRLGAERRVVALLNCHANDLPDHLRHAVSLLQADSKPIDWRQLLTDLRRWSDDDRRVQRAWARSFWGFAGETETETTSSDTGPIAVGTED